MMKTMTAKQYQNLCSRLYQTAMNHEANKDWRMAAAAWFNLSDLREEDGTGPNRKRALNAAHKCK
jgi:hypothetical protein